LKIGVSEGVSVAKASSRGLMTPPLYLIIPFVLTGVLVSYRSGGDPDLPDILIFFVSVVIIAAATNLFDDFFDVRNGIDVPGAPNTRYRKHPVFDMSIRPEALLRYGILLLVILGIILLLFSILFQSLPILLILPLGAIISYGYTGDPFRLKYRGLGEVAVSLSFIALSLIEIFSTSGAIDSVYILLILQGALSFPTVIFSGNIRDYSWDRDSGIRTVATILGTAGSVSVLRIIWAVSTAFGILFLISLSRPVLVILALPQLLTMLAAFFLSGMRDKTKIETFIGTCAFTGIMISLAALILM